MWEYLTLFVLAATPLLELLVAIPLGIGYGLDPVAVFMVTVVGNLLPVLVIVAGYDRWRRGRSTARQAAGNRAATAPPLPVPEPAVPASRRQRRAARLLARYGTPGLALLAPALTGAHLAAMAALALGADRRSVALWIAGSIVAWSLGVSLATIGGLEALRRVL